MLAATTIWNRFTQIDPSDPEREFSMLIDFSDGNRYAGAYARKGRYTSTEFMAHQCLSPPSAELFAAAEWPFGPRCPVEPRPRSLHIHQAR